MNRFLLFCIPMLIISCSFSVNKNKNLANSESDFPENSIIIESMKLTTETLDEYEDVSVPDSLSIIKLIDLKKLKSIINPEKESLLYFWTSGTDSIKIIKDLKKLKQKYDNIYCISTDIGSKAQIRLLRKYLYKNKIYDTTYITYNKFSSVKEVVDEAKTLSKIEKFIQAIDKNSENITLPYMIRLKNNYVTYRGESSSRIFENEQDKITAFKGMDDFYNNSSSNEEELMFPSQLTIDYMYDETEVRSEYIISPVNYSDLNEKMNADCKKIIHIWGSWCSRTSLGILDVKDLIPDDGDNYELILVAADMQTDGQITLVERFLFKNDISINSYLIKNEFKDINSIEKFKEMSHLKNFVQSFDKDYKEIALPYTVVLDENNNIIYKRELNMNEDDIIDNSIDYQDSLIEEFSHMEIKKILNIVKK